MTPLDVILLSLALAMDCFAVSTANSISYAKECNLKSALKMALFFGAFQAAMPMIGWSLGIGFANTISKYSGLVALIILGALGLKMIHASLRQQDDSNDVSDKRSPFTSLTLLTMFAIATSIDALATGLVFVPYPIVKVLAIIASIGFFSFITTLTGCYIGKRFGHKFNVNVELIGGLILIAIGLKIYICG